MATDLATALRDLLTARDAEEAHVRQTAPQSGTRAYCWRARELRDEVRRLRREAAAALKAQEDAA